MKLIKFPNCECLHWFRNKARFFTIEPINGLHVSVFYICEKNKFFIYPSSGNLYRSATSARQNTKDREIDSRKKEIFLVVECSLKIQFANFWYTLPKKTAALNPDLGLFIIYTFWIREVPEISNGAFRFKIYIFSSIPRSSKVQYILQMNFWTISFSFSFFLISIFLCTCVTKIFNLLNLPSLFFHLSM